MIAALNGDAQRGLISESLVGLLMDNYDLINDKRDVESRAASRKYQEILAGRAE